MYGREIQKARKARNLSIRQLAAAAQVSRRYLGLIESDDANVSLAVLSRVAGVLGIKQIVTHGFRVVFKRQDVTAVVLAAVAGMLEELSAVQTLLLSTAQGSGSSKNSDEALLLDIARSQRNTEPRRAETPFAGRYVTPETLPSGPAVSLWSPEWLLPVDRFSAVSYGYPEPEDERFLRAIVLDDSMAPQFRPGDRLRIDTAVRAPAVGQMVAVHGMLSGSVIGAAAQHAVLMRSNAAPVELWRERFIVQGAVTKAA